MYIKIIVDFQIPLERQQLKYVTKYERRLQVVPELTFWGSPGAFGQIQHS